MAPCSPCSELLFWESDFCFHFSSQFVQMSPSAFESAEERTYRALLSDSPVSLSMLFTLFDRLSSSLNLSPVQSLEATTNHLLCSLSSQVNTPEEPKRVLPEWCETNFDTSRFTPHRFVAFLLANGPLYSLLLLTATPTAPEPAIADQPRQRLDDHLPVVELNEH